MINESIKFNDENGKNDTANYLGPVLHDESLKHKIRRSDDAEYLIDREYISSLTIPYISNFPIPVEQYPSELHNLTPEQLNNIANPDTLDNNQRDLIALYSEMNHLPFPAMIKIS